MASSEISRRPHDVPGIVAAIGFIGLGVFLIAETRSMTPMGSVFPIAVSAAMIVCAIVLIVRNVVIGLRRPAADQETEPVAQKPVTLEETRTAGGSNARRLGFLAVMTAWIVLIPILGFFAASILSYFAIMAISLHERPSLREGLVMILIGVATLVGFYLLMANVLLLPLPRGIFF